MSNRLVSFLFPLAVLASAAILAVPLLVTPIKTNAAPAPEAQHYVWRNVEIGGGGGFVDGIIFHPKKPGLIYCRTDIGGVYRYNSALQRWIPLTDWVGSADGNLRGGESLAIDPTDANRVYVAAGTYLEPNLHSAILRSDDQGRSWKVTPLPVLMGGNADGRSIGERLAVDPNKPSILYFGSRQDGLWRSADYGATFTRVTSFPSVPSAEPSQGGGWHPLTHAGIGIIVFDPRSGSAGQSSKVIYAGVEAPEVPGLYRSVNGGRSWSAVPGQPKAGFMPQHIGIDRTGMLYATYSNGLGPNGITDGAVYKMNTRTGVWTDISPVHPDASSGRPGGFAGLSMDPNRPGTLVVSTLDYWNPGDDVFYTSDGGGHWFGSRENAVMDPTGAPWLRWGDPKPRFGWWTGAVAMDPFDPKRVMFGTGATIWGTDDILPVKADQPTHWRMVAEGVEETAAIALVSPPSGEAHLISGLGDIGGFTHHNLTETPPEGMSEPILTSTRSLDYAELAPNIVVRTGSPDNNDAPGDYSADGGNTWTQFATTPAGTRDGGSIALAADGKTIVWAPDRAPMSYSTDGGATWTASSGFGQADPTDAAQYWTPGRWQVVADRGDASRIYALDNAGPLLWTSTDSGRSFQVDVINPKYQKPTIKSVFGRAGDLWLEGGGEGLSHSSDGGKTFTPVASVAVADGIAFGKAAPSAGYPAVYLVGKPAAPANAPYGVYRSDDAGASWTRINDDQHQYGWIGEPLAADPRVYGRVYLGTNGRGILYGDIAPQTTASR